MSGSLLLHVGFLWLQLEGFSSWWLLWLHSTDSRAEAQWLWDMGGVAPRQVVIFQDQESNPCLLHCKTDSQLLDHKGSLKFLVFDGGKRININGAKI